MLATHWCWRTPTELHLCLIADIWPGSTPWAHQPDPGSPKVPLRPRSLRRMWSRSTMHLRQNNQQILPPCRGACGLPFLCPDSLVMAFQVHPWRFCAWQSPLRRQRLFVLVGWADYGALSRLETTTVPDANRQLASSNRVCRPGRLRRLPSVDCPLSKFLGSRCAGYMYPHPRSGNPVARRM